MTVDNKHLWQYSILIDKKFTVHSMLAKKLGIKTRLSPSHNPQLCPIRRSKGSQIFRIALYHIPSTKDFIIHGNHYTSALGLRSHSQLNCIVQIGWAISTDSSSRTHGACQY